MSQDPGASERPSVRDGVLRTLAIAAVLVAAVFVFGFLPRISAPPVVTTERAAPATMPPPRPHTAPSRPDAQRQLLRARGPGPPRSTARLEPRAAPALPSPPPTSGRRRCPTAWPPSIADRWPRPAKRSRARSPLDRGRRRCGTASRGSQAAQKDASLTEHRSRALRAEAAEDWSAARNEYEAAQKLDPAVAFAVEGRPRATERLALDERLEGYLKRPDRLTTEAVAREAEAVLDRAAEVEQPGPRLRAADDRAARGPGRGTTRRPGAPRLRRPHRRRRCSAWHASGLFKEKSLQLRPGSYVVVGTRKGYRDTRVILEVAAGRPAPPVRVRCEETL